MTDWRIIPFQREKDEHLDWLVALWNGACGQELAITRSAVEFNTRASRGAVQAGRIALDGDGPVGFVLVSAHPGAPEAMPRDRGWIDAVAVSPAHQRRGIATRLLAWAEGWLADQGARHVLTGGSLRPFAPGLPPERGAPEFLATRGFRSQHVDTVWDLSRDLRGYEPPSGLVEIAGAVRPARPADEEALLGFLAREFPGRWLFEAEEFLGEGGRISDYMLLWTEGGVQGACHLTFEDSVWPMERFFPYRLPRPWGQLGSIGVAAELRGRGLGLALLDGGLRRLHDNGVNGCVIDWTTLLDFYARCGFAPYHRWIRGAKTLPTPGQGP